MQLKQFEEVDAWKEARRLTRMVYELTAQAQFKRDLGLTSQIQRAATSVMSNIAEGFDGGSTLEFVRFLGYARRSTSEVQSHLYIASDQGYITPQQFAGVYEQAALSRRLISAFVRYLRGAATRRPTPSHPANRLTGQPTGKPANRQTG